MDRTANPHSPTRAVCSPPTAEYADPFLQPLGASLGRWNEPLGRRYGAPVAHGRSRGRSGPRPSRRSTRRHGLHLRRHRRDNRAARQQRFASRGDSRGFLARCGSTARGGEHLARWLVGRAQTNCATDSQPPVLLLRTSPYTRAAGRALLARSWPRMRCHAPHARVRLVEPGPQLCPLPRGQTQSRGAAPSARSASHERLGAASIDRQWHSGRKDHEPAALRPAAHRRAPRGIHFGAHRLARRRHPRAEGSVDGCADDPPVAQRRADCLRRRRCRA